MNRNIVVFCLDTVRKDYFDDYASRIRTASDLSFDRWYASSSWTVASHGTMFTSKIPSNAGININNYHLGSVDINETFLADLDPYWTLCASANGFLHPAFDVDSLFDELVTTSSLQRYSDGINISEFLRSNQGANGNISAFLREALTHEHPIKSILNGGYMKLQGLFRRSPLDSPFDDGARVLERKIKAKIRDQSPPVFAYVNLMEAHGPHQPVFWYDNDIYSGPSQWSSNVLPDDSFAARQNIDQPQLKHFRSLYGAAIEYLDRRVMRMIDACRASLDGETTFIITADHGENLGYEADDYRVGHESSLSEGVLHVPMEIINPPDCTLPEGSSLYSHRDFGDLIVGLANNRWNVSPRELVTAERIGTELGDIDLEEGDLVDGRRMIRAVVEHEQKYIWDSSGAADRFEVDPETPSFQRRVASGVTIPNRAKQLFDDDIQSVHNSRGAESGDVPEDSVERLKHLGYL